MKKKIWLLLLTILIIVSCSEVVMQTPSSGNINNPNMGQGKQALITIDVSKLVQPKQSLTREINDELLKPEVNFFQVFIFNRNLIYTDSVNTDNTGTILQVQVFAGEYTVVLLAGHQKDATKNIIAYLASAVKETTITDGSTVQMTMRPIKMNFRVPEEDLLETDQNFVLDFNFDTRHTEILGPESVKFSSTRKFKLCGCIGWEYETTYHVLTLPESSFPSQTNEYFIDMFVKFFTNEEEFKLIGDNYMSLKTKEDQFVLDSNYVNKIYNPNNENHFNSWVLPTFKNVNNDAFEDVVRDTTYKLILADTNIEVGWE